jgi:hypothetical protein
MLSNACFAITEFVPYGIDAIVSGACRAHLTFDAPLDMDVLENELSFNAVPVLSIVDGTFCFALGMGQPTTYL